MKFRTDFVTNSSSSSFVAVTITKKDGSEIKGEASMGSGYHENPILYFDLNEEDIVKNTVDNSSTGVELCHQIYNNVLYDFNSVHDAFTDIRNVESFDDVSLINVVVRQEGSSSGEVFYTYDMSKKEGEWKYGQVEYDYDDTANNEYFTPMYDTANGFNENGTFEIKNGVVAKYNGKDEYVTVPEGVIGIGVNAFFYNMNVKSVHLPSSVKFIDVGAFRYCSKLEKITLPNGLECIGATAFANCSGLTEIDLPDSVVEIGYKCFTGSGLKNVKIPLGASVIKPGVFYDCEKLENIIMHVGITEIGEDAFMGCDHLCEITIPNGVTKMGDCALWDCKMLQKITLPATLKSFYAGQTLYSSILCEIIVDKDSKYLKVVNGGLYTYDGKKLIKCLSKDKEFTIEDGTVYVGEYAFYQNEAIERVNFPSTVKSIGIEAFCGCRALTEIDLPMGLLTIDYEAFHACTSLKTVYAPSTVKSDFDNCFDTYDGDVTIISK